MVEIYLSFMDTNSVIFLTDEIKGKLRGNEFSSVLMVFFNVRIYISFITVFGILQQVIKIYFYLNSAM